MRKLSLFFVALSLWSNLTFAAGGPTPTPTVEPTAAPTATPTNTPTATPTPTPYHPEWIQCSERNYAEGCAGHADVVNRPAKEIWAFLMISFNPDGTLKASALQTPTPAPTADPTNTPQPTATPAPGSTATPEPEPTNTPAPTATPAPSATATPAATPTAAPTATPAPGLVLLVRSSAFSTDQSPSQHPITVIGSVTQSTEHVHPTSSIKFTPDSALTMPGSDDFSFGAGDFTLSAWIYRVNAGDFAIVGNYAPNTRSFFWVIQNGKVDFQDMLSIGTIPVAAWTKVDVIRSEGIVTFYIDGNASGSWDVTSAGWNNLTGGGNGLSIGTINGNGSFLMTSFAYVEDIAIYKGYAYPPQ